MSLTKEPNKSFISRLILASIIAVFLSIFLVSMSRGMVDLSYYPTFPRQGEPLFIKVSVSNLNPDLHGFLITVYSDGVEITEWATDIKEWGTREFMFISEAGDLLGKSKRIYVEAVNLDLDSRQEGMLMIPPYPPEICSSFTSFASFSTTLMTYMQSFTYYQATLIPEEGLNVGLITSLTLIGLLVFEELSDPSYGGIGRRLLELRIRYGRMVVVLLIIFFAMVFTRVALIVWGGA